MDLTVQKRIAAGVLKCGVNRVVFDETAAARIKEAITKTDMRGLVKAGVVRKEQKKGVSRVRANKRIVQRSRGRQSGSGTRKGRRTARLPDKRAWMNKVRSQRVYLQELREEKAITQAQFKMLYGRVKGNFFRSKRHIKLFLEETAGKEVTQ
jgi:large subunit ribosomal protein L19e